MRRRPMRYGVIVGWGDSFDVMHGPYDTPEKAISEAERLRAYADRHDDSDLQAVVIRVEGGSIRLSDYDDALVKS